MYDVYINHFNRNNQLINTEELMFSVPQQGGFPLSKPIVKQSEDSADNFSFTIETNSPYYDSLLQLKTIIRVVYDGDIIFMGRVLSINTSTIYHTKNVTCEGTFSYFNDSYYEGVQEKQRTKLSVSSYYTKIIQNHNLQVPNEKEINKGTVGVTLPTEEEKYEPTSWTQSSSLISNLASNHGGHMKIRYSGTTPYLDWYKYYAQDLGDDLRPSVTIGKNILDISSNTGADNIFTRVIPIGDTNKDGEPVYIQGYVYTDKNGTSHTHGTKYISVTLLQGTNGLYTNNELTDEFHDYSDYRDAETNYGVIYKTMSFPDADTQEKLWNYTKKWIKESYFGSVTQFTVKAIDMHITNQSDPKILLGELVDVNYLINRNGSLVWEHKKLACKSIQYDLFNPENNSYTFGIPSDILEHSSTKKKKKENTVSASVGNKAVPRGTEDGAVTWRKVLRLIGEQNTDPDYDGTAAYYSFKENGELSGTVTCYVSEEIPDHDVPAHKDKWFTAHLIGRITLVGRSIKWVAISEDRGIFAYVGNSSSAHAVTHWYSKHTGYNYEASAPGSSTFSGSSDSYAMMIAKDTSLSYGGVDNANAFISNGRISGSVNCYDPSVTNDPTHHPEAIFTAQIIGKFGSGTIKYVAISSEYGMFAYTHTAPYQGYPEAVAHWYIRVKGMTVDNTRAFIKEDKDGSIYATGGSGNIGDKKTVVFEPTILTGQGSQGEMKVGYDLTSQSDKWQIELNIPITYLDADGVQRTADGFVKASDFSVQEIPSFKTKIGIFDIVIAGKVEAVQIAADLAEVRKWLGDTIIAGTAIRTARLNATNINANTYEINILDPSTGEYGLGYLNNCYSTLLVSYGTGNDLGKTFLQFGKIGGGVSQDIPINFHSVIPDTIFSKVNANSFLYKYGTNNANSTELGTCYKDCTVSDSNGTVTFTFTRANGVTVEKSFNLSTIIPGLIFSSLSSNSFLYKYGTNNANSTELGTCYTGCSASESSGTITLTFTKADGTTATTNFNMAATQFYQDAVAAAKVEGWEGCYDDIGLNYSSSQTISAGGSITIYPAAKATPTASHSNITTKGIVIYATGGGAPTVDLNGAGPSATVYDNPPTTPMQKANGQINGHIWYQNDDGKWAYLRGFTISYPTS